MKCKQIEILLADYLDGELSAQDTARVEEHLQHCTKCTEELRFLKKYKREIALLRKVKAPDDFLAKVHRRIEKPAGKDGIINILFFPLKIKLPLEAAGVCALVLIAIFLFNPFRTDNMEYRSDESPRDATRRGGGYESGSVTEQKSYKSRHPMAAKETREAPAKKLLPTHESRVAVAETKRARSLEKGSSDKIAEKKDSELPGHGEITLYLARNIDSEAELSMKEAKPQEYQRQAGKTVASLDDTAAQAKKEKKTDRLTESSLKDQGPAVAGIEEILHSLDGRLILKVYDHKSKSYQQMIVEIPAKNYNAFLNKLSSAWNLRKQVPGNPPGNITTLKINLQFER